MADYMRFIRDRYEQGKGLPDDQRTKLMYLAIDEYMDAKQVLPIRRSDYEKSGDPFACSATLPMFAAGVVIDSMDEGMEAAAAFDVAFNDISSDCLFRVMRPEERAAPGQLLARMSEEDRTTAMSFFGAGNVAKAIVRDDALDTYRTSSLRP